MEVPVAEERQGVYDHDQKRPSDNNLVSGVPNCFKHACQYLGSNHKKWKYIGIEEWMIK